jgi:N-hydroxyarylamine O-acetyltransferase
MNLAAYFARIGYDGPQAPSLPVLQALASRHPQAIAFDNTEVAAGRVPDISLPAVQAKLVGARRGGYCYEHNTLLQGALTAMGFRLTTLSARVRYRLPPDFVAARAHMVLCVELGGEKYLVDSGFGGLTLTAPLPLLFHVEQPTPHETFRFVPAEGDFRLQARLGDEWADVYQFDLAPHLPPDYVAQNWYTATRPGALFASTLIATRPVPGGRWALMNRTLTWRPTGGTGERRLVEGAAAVGDTLRDIFGLHLPADEVARIAEVAARSPAELAGFL